MILRGIAINEKGNLKPAVRNEASKAITNKIAKHVQGTEVVDGKNVLVVVHTDAQGNEFYTSITVSTSLKHPSELATRKPSKKEESAISFE